MKYQAEVIVKLKNGVRDPQGAAVDTVLKRTGIEENAQVNVGKYFMLSVSADTHDEARDRIETICHEVLSNPILETYQIQKLESL